MRRVLGTSRVIVEATGGREEGEGEKGRRRGGERGGRRGAHNLHVVHSRVHTCQCDMHCILHGVRLVEQGTYVYIMYTIIY